MPAPNALAGGMLREFCLWLSGRVKMFMLAAVRSINARPLVMAVIRPRAVSKEELCR